MNDTKFTFEQFVDDAKKYANPINKEGLFKLNNRELFYFVESSDDIKARAYPMSSGTQFGIQIYTGLLRKLYEFVLENYSKHYEANRKSINLSKNAFLRFMCNILGEMAFWHEFSHVARNHFLYLDSSLHELDTLNKRRIVEMDADIFGASMLLARVLSIPEKTIPIDIAVSSFAIGVRGLFEVLHINFPPDLKHENSDYPHAQARAYTAFSFAMTSPFIEKMDKHKILSLQSIGAIAFINFEHQILGSKFDEGAVNSMRNDDFDKWEFSQKEIGKNSLIVFNARTIGEKASTYARYADVAFSKLFGG